MQKIQRTVQDLRVRLIRAAGRLGLRYDSEQVRVHCLFGESVRQAGWACATTASRALLAGYGCSRKAVFDRRLHAGT